MNTSEFYISLIFHSSHSVWLKLYKISKFKVIFDNDYTIKILAKFYDIRSTCDNWKDFLYLYETKYITENSENHYSLGECLRLYIKNGDVGSAEKIINKLLLIDIPNKLLLTNQILNLMDNSTNLEIVKFFYHSNNIKLLFDKLMPQDEENGPYSLINRVPIFTTLEITKWILYNNIHHSSDKLIKQAIKSGNFDIFIYVFNYIFPNEQPILSYQNLIERKNEIRLFIYRITSVSNSYILLSGNLDMINYFCDQFDPNISNLSTLKLLCNAIEKYNIPEIKRFLPMLNNYELKYNDISSLIQSINKHDHIDIYNLVYSYIISININIKGLWVVPLISNIIYVSMISVDTINLMLKDMDTNFYIDGIQNVSPRISKILKAHKISYEK